MEAIMDDDSDTPSPFPIIIQLYKKAYAGFVSFRHALRMPFCVLKTQLISKLTY